MVIGEVRLYQMKGSMSSGEYPLVTGNESQRYRVRNVKYPYGLQTEIDLPLWGVSDFYNSCNVARIGDDDYYWITSIRQRTAIPSQESVHMTLDYMAPTSLLRSGDTISGIWKRLPQRYNDYLQDQVTNGPMVEEFNIPLSSLNCKQSKPGYKTYWIQVTGHDNNGNIKQFGGFILYDDDDESFDWLNGAYSGPTASDPDYVPYGEWMSNIYTYTGLTESDIDDVSISKRCPFQHTQVNITGNHYYLRLTNSGGAIVPTTVGNYVLYRLSSLRLAGNPPSPNSDTYTVTLTDNNRLLGKMSVRDWNNNDVMNIDVGRFGSTTPIVEAVMHSDTHGIYCCIRVGEQFISIPEGKLPYFGNTAANYAAYSMDSDRMAMQFAIQTAHYNRETADNVTIGNTVAGVATNVMVGALNANPVSILSGVAGGVASGIASAYEASRAMNLSLLQANQDYELTRKRAIDQPSGGYNIAYGGMYAYLNEANPLKIRLEMPKANSNYISDWISNYGYPAEGYADVGVTTGYYKGKLIVPSGSSVRGQKWDRMNEVFMKGFKFVNPTI